MKRFTETTKWKDPWFRALPNDLKLLWIWLCDECDNAGVWIVCKEDIEYALKKKINWDKVNELFSNKIIQFDNREEKWLIKNFIKFQYSNNLSDKNPAHIHVLKLIDKYQLNNIFDAQATPYAGCSYARKDMDMDMDMEKNKEKKGVTEGGKTIEDNFIKELFPGMKFVRMTKEEYDKIVAWRDKEIADEAIIDIELWCGKNGKKYKDYYLATLDWIRRNEKRQSERNKTTSAGS